MDGELTFIHMANAAIAHDLKALLLCQFQHSASKMMASTTDHVTPLLEFSEDLALAGKVSKDSIDHGWSFCDKVFCQQLLPGSRQFHFLKLQISS